MNKTLRYGAVLISLLGLTAHPSFAGTTVESLLNGSHIDASGSSQYFWGPLVSQNEIQVGGSANNNFPLMFAGTTISGNGGGGPYSSFCSPGPDVGPNVAIAPSLTPVNQWFCHNNVPALPNIDFNHYKALAQSQGNNCGGHSCYVNSSNVQYSGTYDPVCTVGADTKVWYFEGDVKFTGGTYFCGILITQGSIIFSGSGAGNTIVAPPPGAWDQYVVDTPAGSAHPQGDTSASDEYPGDAGLHAVKPFNFSAGGGGFNGKMVTFHGYLYAAAGYSTTGGNLIVGVVHQGPSASASSGGGSTLFFEPQTVFTPEPPTPPNTVAKPQIIPDGGNFIDPVRVSIIDSTPGAAIHYTLDGSIPTGASPLYTGPFVLSTNTIVKAIGTLAGMNDSAIAVAAFTFIGVPHNPPPTLSVVVIPSIVNLGASQQQTFTAVVSGTGVTNTKVTWSISPNIGSLTVNGSNQAIYTAPASITSQQTVTLTAVSLQDNFTKGTAAINLFNGTPPPPPPPTPVCGDASCNGTETCTSCALDCGACPPPPPPPPTGPICGNNSCETGESCTTCALDCGVCPPPPPPPVTCGNSTCDSGESCSNCSADCGVCPPPPPPPPVSCGNNSCDSGETCSNCSADCGSCPPPVTCGNNTCDSGESCSTCSSDCGVCPPPPPPTGPICGNNSCDTGESCTTCALDCGVCPPPPPPPPPSAVVTRIVVSPATAIVAANATKSFSAQAFDQNNSPMTGVSFSWSVNGSQNTMSPSNGTSSTFTAGMMTGSFTVTASASGKSGTARVTILASGTQSGAGNINDAKPHPVPFKSTSGLGGVTFSGLAENTTIRIFNPNGRLVKTLHSIAGEDVLWAVNNDGGEKVASSVYFYIIDHGSETKKGKLVVIQ